MLLNSGMSLSKRALMISGTSLVNADTIEYIKTLPDNCIDLIATDPPYYRVKSCD
jgi:adenine-specific DNA-methyltransferase